MIWEGGGEHPYTTDFALEYYSASARHRVRYEFNVKWDLHRVVE